MKIVILDRDTLSPQTVLRTPSFRHEIQSWGRTAAEEVADRIADADIVVLNKVKLTAEAIEWCLRVGEGNPLFLHELASHLGETGRTRPLRPGVSIAHVDVSAGTLGAFVHKGGVVHALSNYHVLSGTPQAEVGDLILQPGPADGGQAPDDRVGTLAARVDLVPGRDATVDCALALLDDQEVDPTYPVGLITATAVALGGEKVAKIGRTTSITRGHVTAIELDNVVVGYGEELGEISFDNQIEVESTGRGPFSRGGDSGSLVYREDGVALGLLFAGSESGGENGSGLTYINSIDAVLDALGVTLV